MTPSLSNQTRKKELPIPEGMEYWRADSVAECLSTSRFVPEGYELLPENQEAWRAIQKAYAQVSYGDAEPYMILDRKLWGFLDSAKNPTPMGGDGSNGTVETPDGQLDLDNDDKPRYWWTKLTIVEQTIITKAFDAEFNQ